MRIGISLLGARAHRTGVENTVYNLVTQLSTIKSEDEYVIYANMRTLPWLSHISRDIQVIHVRFSSARAPWIWEHLFFLTSRHPKEVDLVHFPIGGGVVGYRGKFVLTIHDLIRYSHREIATLRRYLLWRVWCKANIKRATKIIAVSEHVKQDILREFPVDPDSIRVILNGVDRRFSPTSGTQGVREKYNLPERYVLFVGSTGLNKNLKRAIDAMNLVRTKHNLDHQFIVAGLPGNDDATLRKHVSSNNLQDTVRFLGYVDDDDLQHLYGNAKLFLFPSLMEGFGIPPLEAMRCGIPVVAAKISCLPEVLGDAAIWVDPLSVDSIAEGIATGLLDENIRSRMTSSGLSRAAEFSWEKMALDTVGVYREAIECQ